MNQRPLRFLHEYRELRASNQDLVLMLDLVFIEAHREFRRVGGMVEGQNDGIRRVSDGGHCQCRELLLAVVEEEVRLDLLRNASAKSGDPEHVGGRRHGGLLRSPERVAVGHHVLDRRVKLGQSNLRSFETTFLLVQSLFDRLELARDSLLLLLDRLQDRRECGGKRRFESIRQRFLQRFGEVTVTFTRARTIIIRHFTLHRLSRA